MRELPPLDQVDRGFWAKSRRAFWSETNTSAIRFTFSIFFDDEYKFHQVVLDVSQEPFGLRVHIVVLSREHGIALNVSAGVYERHTNELIRMDSLSHTDSQRFKRGQRQMEHAPARFHAFVRTRLR